MSYFVMLSEVETSLIIQKSNLPIKRARLGGLYYLLKKRFVPLLGGRAVYGGGGIATRDISWRFSESFHQNLFAIDYI